MWPKMLIELLPHLSRLVPMWEKFLNSRAASERASENALAAMAEGVRGDLGQVTAAHAGLYRQLQDQSAQIALLAEELKHARDAAERAETAVRSMSAETTALTQAVKGIGFGLAAVLVLLVIVIVMQILHHGA